MTDRAKTTTIKNLIFLTKDSVSGRETLYEVHPNDVETIAFHIPFPDAIKVQLKDLALLASEFSGDTHTFESNIDEGNIYLKDPDSTPYDMIKQGNNVSGAFFVAKDYSSGNENFYEVNGRGIARFAPHTQNVSKKMVPVQNLLLLVWKLMGNAIGSLSKEDSNEQPLAEHKSMPPTSVKSEYEYQFYNPIETKSMLDRNNNVKLKNEPYWSDVFMENGVFGDIDISIVDTKSENTIWDTSDKKIETNQSIHVEQPNNPLALMDLKRSLVVSQKIKGRKKKISKIKSSLESQGRPSRYIKIGDEWQCTRCEMTLAERHYFRNHTDTCFDTEKEILKCGECEKTFKDASKLKSHLASSKDCSKKEAIPTLICEQCSIPRVFFNVQKYQGHILRHQDVIKCKECDATFKRYPTYVYHIRDAHTQRQYQCDQCHKSFAEQSILDRHKGNWHVDHYCDVCGNKYKSNHALMMHMEKHEIGPFPCPKCPKLCQSKNVLVYHLKRHNGDLRFNCEDCGKKFIAKDKLQIHIRSIHTNERPYTCETCGKTFVRSDKMSAHKRRFHTFEKPYECDKCDWKGVEASDLCHHKKRHRFEDNDEYTENNILLPLADDF